MNYIECKDCAYQYDCDRKYLCGCTDGKEWEQEKKKLTDDTEIDVGMIEDARTFVALFVEFDEMGFTPTTTCPNPEEYAREWKMAMLKKVHRLQSENKTLKAELRKECEEHEEFTKKAKEEIERLTELQSRGSYRVAELGIENADLQKQVEEKIEEKVGYWVYSEKGCVMNCSNCGERLEFCYPDGKKIKATKYCPNCGAKMRDFTGGMRCRPIRIEVQNLVYLMGEWAIENNMCWNDEHAKKLAYYILDKHYRKESDTAKEIFSFIVNQYDGEYFLHNVETFIADKYGVEVE